VWFRAADEKCPKVSEVFEDGDRRAAAKLSRGVKVYRGAKKGFAIGFFKAAIAGLGK
jgi:hypothetical protein